MKGSGNYQRENEDQRVYTVYQELRIISEEAMQKQKEGEISLEKFKKVLNRFYGHYRTKWEKSSIEKPEFLDDEENFVDDLNQDECRKLHFKLCELAEDLGDLGHMNEKYAEKENKGGQKTADEVEDKLDNL